MSVKLTYRKTIKHKRPSKYTFKKGIILHNYIDEQGQNHHNIIQYRKVVRNENVGNNQNYK